MFIIRIIFNIICNNSHMTSDFIVMWTILLTATLQISSLFVVIVNLNMKSNYITKNMNFYDFWLKHQKLFYFTVHFYFIFLNITHEKWILSSNSHPNVFIRILYRALLQMVYFKLPFHSSLIHICLNIYLFSTEGRIIVGNRDSMLYL